MPQRKTSVTVREIAMACGAAACCAWLLAKLLGVDYAPAPFAWSDVALVSFLATLPLAALLADWIHQRTTQIVAIVAAGGSLIVHWMLLGPIAPPIFAAGVLALALVLGITAVLPE